MKEIILHGKHGEGRVALISDEDFEKVNQFRWVVGKYYRYDKLDYRYYVRGHISVGNQVLLHRFILNVTERNVYVDHKNGNPFDNTRDNIRLASSQENGQNQKKRLLINGKECTSQYKGVSFNKRDKKYEVYCDIPIINLSRSKRIRLGKFESEIEAALAYDEAARKYHGEFAKLNIPQ